MLKRLSLFIFAALFALPLTAGNFAGTITPAGYSPPPGVFVKWCRFGRDCKVYPLNPAAPFPGPGSPADCRYRGCDPTANGMESYPAMASEHGGGEVTEILADLFKEAGLLRPPDDRERYDFGFANFGGRVQAVCSDYLAVMGRPRPGCTSVVESEDRLPLKPSEPPGCGRRSLPCPLEMGLVPGEVRQIPARTASGGRVGMFAIQPARAPGSVAPAPPVVLPPPPPVTPPTPPPPGPVTPPPAPRRCVLVIFQEGAPPSAIETTCPP